MRFLALIFFALALYAQDPAPVLFTVGSDLEALLELDGKPAGSIAAGQKLELSATPGEHQLLAHPVSGGPAWRKLILVSSALPVSVNIPLKAHLLRLTIEKQGYWKDDRTGLVWAAADNGSGTTVSQAHHYCRQLAAGWRLPTIDELQPLFGGPANERGFRSIAPLKLTGWAWSSTQGNEPAENWALDFADGARASVVAGDAGLNRALCVRDPQN